MSGGSESNQGQVDAKDAAVTHLLDHLFRKEGPRLHRYFRGQLRPGEDVRDFVQEAFARLTRAASKALPAQPAAYLQRIARNLLIDRSRLVDMVNVVDVDDQSTRPEQEDAILTGDVMTIYEATLSNMTERTRTIFLLHRIEGLRYREIADRLDISIPAVQKHIAKALEMLAWALQGGE